MAVPRLGIITVGTGPRPELVNYHRALSTRLGLDVEIQVRHALAGLERREIQAIAAKPGDTYVSCYVAEDGGTGTVMGPGFREVWVARHRLIPLLQERLDDLETAGVDATILACAVEYPQDAFHSRHPLVMPSRLMTDWVRHAMETVDDPSIGLLLHDEEHREADTRTWDSEAWMRDIRIVIEPSKGRLWEAVESLRQQRVRLGLFLGYGMGIGPADPPDLNVRIEQALGVPFLTPQRLAGLYVRTLMRPSIDDREFSR